MSVLDLFSHSPGAFFGVVLLALLAFVCSCFAVGLRLARRGAARFWTGPALVALALLPAVAGVALSALSFHAVLGGMALTGSGGVAAVAAGSAESLLPLLTGLGCMAALALFGLLLVAAGTSRIPEGSAGGSAPEAFASPVWIVLVLGLAALLVGTVQGVNSGLRDPGAILLRWRGAFYGSAGLTLLLAAQALAAPWRAPRGPATTPIKLVSLASLGGAVLGAVLALVLVYGRLDSLLRTAVTGVPS